MRRERTNIHMVYKGIKLANSVAVFLRKLFVLLVMVFVLPVVLSFRYWQGKDIKSQGESDKKVEDVSGKVFSAPHLVGIAFADHPPPDDPPDDPPADPPAEQPAPGCAGCCTGSCCFPGGTLVATGREDEKFLTKPIGELKPGENVLSVVFSLLGPRLVSRKIQTVFVHEREAQSFVKVFVESGTSFVATENHPIVISGKNTTVLAGNLKKGQAILVIADRPQWKKVVEVQNFPETTSVYNIELENEPHNYLISSGSQDFVLVHNKFVP